MKTIAITGANGFLGRHCLRKAVEYGITAKGVVRRLEAADLVEKLGAEPIMIKQLNDGELKRAFRGCIGVLHLIGIVSEQYGNLQEVNVNGTRLVLESAYEAQVSRFVVPTGLGIDQYGKKLWATNSYFASKMQIERMCQSSQVPYVIFRPSYILGPGDELLPSLVSAILEGKVLVAGEGNTPMQPIFVDDAATVFLKAATGFGSENSVYDLVGPEVTTMMKLIPRVAGVMLEEGFAVPEYEIENIPLKDAPKTLGLSREEIDVTLCDVLGDSRPFTRDFGITLKPLDEAIRAAVKAAKQEVVG